MVDATLDQITADVRTLPLQSSVGESIYTSGFLRTRGVNQSQTAATIAPIVSESVLPRAEHVPHAISEGFQPLSVHPDHRTRHPLVPGGVVRRLNHWSVGAIESEQLRTQRSYFNPLRQSSARLEPK